MRAVALIAVAAFAAGANAQELLFNPGFDDLNADTAYGDGWGKFGSADFNDFFGGNPHASFFSDGNGNWGGVFQGGIPGVVGNEYRFDLVDVRLEANINANYRFGIEYFLADDATKISDTIVPIDLGTTGDGLSFSMTGVAPAGTVYLRAIIQFDNAVSAGAGQENAFVFTTSMTLVPAPASLLALGGLGMTRRRR